MDGSEGISLQSRVPEICVEHRAKHVTVLPLLWQQQRMSLLLQGVQENNDSFHSNRPALLGNDSFEKLFPNNNYQVPNSRLLKNHRLNQKWIPRINQFPGLN